MFLFPNKGHVVYLPDAGKGSAVCSSLHCGTRYLIAVLVRSTAQVPRWAGNVSGGGQVQFLGNFGVLAYLPSGVARQSHCTPARLSIVMSFGHCTDHCTTGSVAGGAWKKKKLNGKPNVLCWFFVVHKLCLHMHMNEGKFEGNSSRE